MPLPPYDIIIFKTVNVIYKYLKMKFQHNLFSMCILSKIYKENVLKLSRCYKHNQYKVIFFGSNTIAFSSLKKINNLRKNEDTLIRHLDLVTANNSKHHSDLEKYAKSQNINIIKWPLQNLQHGEYDIGLIVAFGHLIRHDVLQKFPLGMVNVHPSLLPRWRGAAPIIYTLMHGDQETGVTLMKIQPDMFDVGEIISQMKVPVPSDIKLPELTEQLSEHGADMLVECIRSLPECLANTKPQNNVGVTYAKKINKNISDVRWSDMSARDVYNLYRAIYSIYPLSTNFKNKQVKLFDAFLHDHIVSENKEKSVGSVEYCNVTSALKVLCKDRQYIYFKSLRILGKRKITAEDFYNGYIKNNQSDNKNIFY